MLTGQRRRKRDCLTGSMADGGGHPQHPRRTVSKDPTTAMNAEPDHPTDPARQAGVCAQPSAAEGSSAGEPELDAAADLPLIARELSMFDFPGHLFRVLDTRAAECYAALTPRSDITPRQVAVLLVLYQVDKASQAQLSALTRTDRNTLGEMISRMTARGLVLRQPSSEDKRAFDLQLSQEGRSVLLQVLPAMLQAQRMLLKRLPVQYHAILLKCLRYLVDDGDASHDLTHTKE